MKVKRGTKIERKWTSKSDGWLLGATLAGTLSSRTGAGLVVSSTLASGLVSAWSGFRVGLGASAADTLPRCAITVGRVATTAAGCLMVSGIFDVRFLAVGTGTFSWSTWTLL